ncbi:MAG: MDR family MFS transporter [Trueperaceae bacterium]
MARPPTDGAIAMTEPAPVTRRAFVLACLVLAMGLAAVEGTIVATAMPSIVAGLGGFEYYAWVFSAFLLAQAVSTPIFGRVADVYGRKPVLIWGLVAFLAASIACGFATSMPLLVAFRLFQGLGAGAIYPMVSTLAGDLYDVHERGRVQGYLASVWGISAVVGPVIGGALIAGPGWPWIFWFSVPLGIVAIFGLRAYLHESTDTRERSIDLTGAALFFVALSVGMLVLTQGPSWGLATSAVLVAVAVAFALAFSRRQRVAPEPLIGFDLWRDPLILVANVATFAAGLLMIGLVTYSPTYVQGVMGYSPTVAGLTLTAMSLGWPLASTLAGRLLVPWGPAWTARVGGAAALVGGVFYLLLAPERGPWWVAAGSFFVGAGMGFINTTMIVTIQTIVPWERRGVGTATNMLMRILGNAVGAAMLGGILNVALVRGVRSLDAAAGGVSAAAGTEPADVSTALRRIEQLMTRGEVGAGVDGAAAVGAAAPGMGSTLGASALDTELLPVLVAGLHTVYVAVFIAAVLVFVLTWSLPRGRRLA